MFMLPSFENIHLLIPEIIILLTVCLAILADLFLKSRFKNIVWIIALTGLFITTGISALFLGTDDQVLLGGLFISDDLAQLMKLFTYLCVFLTYLYSNHYMEERQMPTSEYYILGLFSTLGMMVLVSAHSLLTIYLGLELLSLPLYAMTAIQRSNSDALEAAMKYFVMGAIASGMLLYGFSLLYAATGSLDLSDIANNIAINWQEKGMLLSFSLVFMFAGIGFKMAAAPFHMWAPDVYQGAPTPVTLFISTAPKIAAIGMALRILAIAMVHLKAETQQIVLVMALLSTGIGNFLAVVQVNIKRLLAYSAIAQIGYALFGILAFTNAGFSSSLFYILVYSLMSLAAFGLLVLLSKDGMEIQMLSDLKGLSKRNPWIAFMMMIVMFSMAGVPPTAGFFAKLAVLKALVDVNLTWVAVLGLLFSVIGAYYYIKIVKVMYFEEPELQTPLKLPLFANIAYSINCLALLYLGLFPSGLVNLCMNAF